MRILKTSFSGYVPLSAYAYLALSALCISAQQVTEAPTVAPKEATSAIILPSAVDSQQNDYNKELIDYGDEYMDSLRFEQTLKTAGNESAKAVEALLAKHHNHDDLHQYLFGLAQQYPEITRLYHECESVEGRKLWALEISEEPGKHKLMKPEFRYVANLHGNEVVGRELLLHLARLLVENYKAAQQEPANERRPSGPKFVRKLLRETRIHLMPSANPDGYSRSEAGCLYPKPSERGRVNANRINLNSNFPDPVAGIKLDANTQPETRALMSWSKSTPFVLSAVLHGGALVASYPYDRAANLSARRGERKTADDDVLRNLALIYSKSHYNMHKGGKCYDMCQESDQLFDFPDGITNGAQWYSVNGSMQDWVYDNTDTLEITLELGCNQYPVASQLPQYWDFNKRALLNLIKEAHRGIKGTVRDASSGALLANVSVHVVGRERNVSSTQYGDFFRILMPGHYELVFERAGYQPKLVTVAVQNTMAQILPVELQPLETGAEPELAATEPPARPAGELPGVALVDPAEHSLVVAILVMTIITLLVLILMAGAYIIQKGRFTRSQSMSMELQPTSARSTETRIASSSSLHVQSQ